MRSAPPVDNSVVSEREVRVAGYRVRYLKAGSGPALVLIHGLMGYSFSWRFNNRVLAERFTVYAPDLLGMGFSDRPSDIDYGLRACSERMVEFIDQLGIRTLNLLGTSHGGGVAAMMAAFARDRIEKLVLVDPINPWSRHGRKRIALLSNPLGAFLFRRAFRYMHRTHRFFLRRMYGNPDLVTQATINGYAAGIAQPRSADYGLGVVHTFYEDVRGLKEIYPRLSGIPTLLIWGDRDLAVSPSSAYELQRALPGSELVMLPGIGHMPYEEVPEQFNGVVLDFLLRPLP